jgi:hypothetical protein
MVRSGGSIFFAGYSPWSGWTMLANGGNETIPEPTWWFLDDEFQQEYESLTHKLTSSLTELPATTRKGQLLLELGDSGKLSKRKAA